MERRHYVASWYGLAVCVSLLLDKEGIDVNQAKNNGATPLYVASEKAVRSVCLCCWTRKAST